ncbi:hypothetical protein MYX77_00695 [Acidobacteriia bacterium AH_259_A11_L15]|nr:hypothetical protein [Acidobacteriia bacterium AH_259_A11_L15]
MIQALESYPLCKFFLSQYVQKMTDIDMQRDEAFHVSVKRILLIDTHLIREFEALISSSLQALGLSKEELKKSSEFNFECYNPTNLESFFGVLRAAIFLHEKGYTDLKLLKRASCADILCRFHGRWVCLEVKTLTYDRRGGRGLWLGDQVGDKLKDILPSARRQLSKARVDYACPETILAVVVNWLEQSAVLQQEDYQEIVDKLESGTPNLNQLEGLDHIVFITYFGQAYPFSRTQLASS